MSDNQEQFSFFSTLESSLSRENIANRFGAEGWEVRKCGWSEFEVTSSHAELIIEAEKPTLIHGFVFDSPLNVQHILSVLVATGGSYGAELYSESQQLIEEWGSNAT